MKQVRRPSFRSESTEAAALASALRHRGYNNVFKRNVVDFAASLGIEPHYKKVAKDKKPREVYTAYQSKRIFDEYISRISAIEPFIPTAKPIAPPDLQCYSDSDLVAELRRRGWDVTATRTETL